jgi:hypothetical protein
VRARGTLKLADGDISISQTGPDRYRLGCLLYDGDQSVIRRAIRERIERAKRPLTPARATGAADWPIPLTPLPPYSPPCKAARCTRQRVAFVNMDNGPYRAAENVQFLVMSRRRSTIAGLVLFLVGHLLP